MRAFLAGALALAAAACGTDQLKHVTEHYDIVGGQPSVDPSAPTVDARAGGAKPSDFSSNSPVQVDAFLQKQVGKVDILWVIDDSPSMDPKQDKVKANFQTFMAKLVENNAALDYHIGVVTTDTYNPGESGKLRNSANLAKPWVGRDTCAGGCDPVTAFRQNASVGIKGSGDEKPLLAAAMALTPPLATRENAGFLRPDAALFIIVLSDEEDGSCAPAAASLEGCTAPLTFGAVDYYARLFEGLKGFGNKDFVTVGAIVATTTTELIPDGNGRRGCHMLDLPATEPKAFADYAPRTLELAQKTGGLATSICDRDYLPALQNLGFLATGAKTTFFLTRAPYTSDLRVYVTIPGGARTLKQPGVDYDYEKCGTTGVIRNAVTFRLGSLPPAGATVEAEYTVDVRGVQGC